MPSQTQNGFTLIELSLVLVIIGLIVGGVLVGRDLIKSAEIRAQISQIEEIKTAFNTFQVKYGYLPGDMPPIQASQLGFFTFTGAQAGMGCQSQGYAYGNNDGFINLNNEKYAFWSHLSDAKLMKGSYAGTAGSLLTAAAPICNISSGNPAVAPTTPTDFEKFFPRAKISAATTFVQIYSNYWDSPKNSHPIYSTTKRNHIASIFDPFAAAAMTTTNDLYQLDKKIDDGMPTTGDVRDYGSADFGGGAPSDNPPCTILGSVPLQYDLSPATADTKNCYADFLF